MIASDVENPTLGERGAARVFGPQKGADPAMVELLERNLRHCFTKVYEQIGVDVRTVTGGGAAGAFAAGLMAFLNCRLESGIDLVLAHNRFREKLADCCAGESPARGRLMRRRLMERGRWAWPKLAGGVRCADRRHRWRLEY